MIVYMNGKWSSSKGSRITSGKQKALKMQTLRQNVAQTLQPRSFQQDQADDRPEFRLVLGDSTAKAVSLFHVREADYEVEKRIVAARLPLQRLRGFVRKEEYNFYSEMIELPVRPEWKSGTSKRKLLKNEDKYFESYLNGIYEMYSPQRLNHFEHNIQVWRQLWRVCERSDILLVVADVRHPMFHLPPSLYRYVVELLKKPVIMVLNKIDLVTSSRLTDWKNFLSKEYPGVAIACVTSFPHSISSPCMPELDSSEQIKHQSFRKRKLAPYGIENLMTVVRKMCNLEIKEVIEPIPAKLKVDNLSIDDDDNLPFVNTRTNFFAFLGEEADASLEALTDLNKKHESEKLNRLKGQSDFSKDLSHILEDAPSVIVSHNRSEKSKLKKMWWMIEDLILDDEFEREEDEVDEGESPEQRVVGVLGHPNAGKSSLINAITGHFSVGVSETPGKTKHLQTVILSDELILVDCPGLVFPAVDMPKPLQVLAGIFPIAQTREPYSSLQYLAEQVPLEIIYGFPTKMKNGAASTKDFKKKKGKDADGVETELAVDFDFEILKSKIGDEMSEPWSAWEMCEMYAKMKKFFKPGGVLDTHKAAIEILEHAISGVIDFSSSPSEIK